MPASVNPKLMWLGAAPAHRRNKNPSKPGTNFETADQPPSGYVIPPNEGNIDAKLFYLQMVPLGSLVDIKRWYDSSVSLPAFDFSKAYEMSEMHKVEVWPYFASRAKAMEEAPKGLLIAAQLDLSNVSDSEFPLTVSGQLTKLGGEAADIPGGTPKLYGPVDPTTNQVVDSLVIPLSAKAGPNYFYYGCRWQPEELLDSIVYRANVKIVGQTDKLDTYTGIKIITCGKEVEWLALTPAITDQHTLMSHGTTADPDQQKVSATMYMNFLWSAPGSGADSTLVPAFSPIFTATPMTLSALEAGMPAPPVVKVEKLDDYLKAAHESLFGVDLCIRAPIDELHCETHFTLKARDTPSFGALPHSEVRTYTSPDGSQTIDKVCLTYAGAGYTGTAGGELGTNFCEVENSDSGTVIQGHNPVPIEGGGTWFNSSMFMTGQLGMIAERYSQTLDPETPDWPSGTVGQPGFWMETQDGYVQVPYEHFDRLLSNADQSADGVTYNLDTQKLLDYLGTTEGASLGDVPVNMSFGVRPDNVDWDAIQLAKNVEIYWNSGTLSVSQVPTTWENIKNGAKLVLNVVSTISALASGAALGAAVIRYGATALGGSNVILGAVQTGVKLYKAAQGAGSAADDLWNYPRRETIYTIGDPESMARLAAEHPEFAPKTPTGSGVIK